jgi:hypothetical protein
MIVGLKTYNLLFDWLRITVVRREKVVSEQLEIKPSLATIVQDTLFSFSLQSQVSAHINDHLQAISTILNIKN